MAKKLILPVLVIGVLVLAYTLFLEKYYLPVSFLIILLSFLPFCCGLKGGSGERRKFFFWRFWRPWQRWEEFPLRPCPASSRPPLSL